MSIPKKSELRALAKTAIDASAFVVSKSIPTVIRNGKNDKTIEKHLNRGVGNCTVIEPLLSGKVRDRSASETILDVLFLVKLKQNPERNADDGGGSVDIYEWMDAVQVALTRNARHPGGEFFKVADDAWELSQFDEGLFEYAMFFTKESA